MLEHLRRLLSPSNVVESTTQAAEGAAARAEQATETINALSAQINREQQVEVNERNKAAAANKAARILADAGW